MKKFFLVFCLSYFSKIYAASLPFSLVGTYLLEYSVFKIDVYQVSYLKSSNAERILLDYKMGVKKEYTQEGWRVGLKHKIKDGPYRQKFQWLLDNAVDVEAKDQLSITRTGKLVEIHKNNVLVASIEDGDIALLAFEPWIGEMPLSVKMKEALLGNYKH